MIRSQAQRIANRCHEFNDPRRLFDPMQSLAGKQAFWPGQSDTHPLPPASVRKPPNTADATHQRSTSHFTRRQLPMVPDTSDAMLNPDRLSGFSGRQMNRSLRWRPPPPQPITPPPGQPNSMIAAAIGSASTGRVHPALRSGPWGCWRHWSRGRHSRVSRRAVGTLCRRQVRADAALFLDINSVTSPLLERRGFSPPGGPHVPSLTSFVLGTDWRRPAIHRRRRGCGRGSRRSARRRRWPPPPPWRPPARRRQGRPRW